MPHAYTEDQLVEQPAIGLFAELGWTVAGPPPNAGVAGEPRDAGLLGRETKGGVVLVSRLRVAHSALPSPQPGLPATLIPLGEGPGDEGAQLSLPPEAVTAAVSGIGLVSPAGGKRVLSETSAVRGGLGLIERLAAAHRKSLISSRFLFE